MFDNHKPVLICTQHRGVFFGFIPDDYDVTQRTFTNIKGARMAIYWGTTKGVMELAESGPTSNTRVGAAATIEVLHDITGVFSVTEEAAKKWIKA